MGDCRHFLQRLLGYQARSRQKLFARLASQIPSGQIGAAIQAVAHNNSRLRPIKLSRQPKYGLQIPCRRLADLFGGDVPQGRNPLGD